MPRPMVTSAVGVTWVADEENAKKCTNGRFCTSEAQIWHLSLSKFSGASSACYTYPIWTCYSSFDAEFFWLPNKDIIWLH